MHASPFRNEPISDYARNTEAADKALKAFLPGGYHPAIIDGTARETEATILSTSPAHPSLVLGRSASCSSQDLEAAITSARNAFPAWSRTPPAERAKPLFRLAEQLRQNRFHLIALLNLEIGKDWYEADAEVAEAIDFCEYYGRLATVHFQDMPLTHLPEERNRGFYIPLGVGAIIAPWNFPIAILTGMAMAAVVSGNTILIKPSSDTVVLASRIFALATAAGIPPGVMNLVPFVGSDLGDHLVCHPHIRFIAFTGSESVGLCIQEHAAQRIPQRPWLTRFSGEMGGKNAILVDETADLEAASAAIVKSAYGFQGQKCSACSRVIADRRIKGPLLDLVVDRLRRLPVADTWTDHPTYLGPVANPSAFQSILKAIAVGRSEARLVLGGKPLDREGYFIQATLFDEVESPSFLGQEEIFGPVLSFLEVGSFEEGLQIANGTRFGLTGALFSQAPERLEQAQLDFHVGNLYLNRACTGAMVGVHPFGGFNRSGTDSKAGGPDYLLNFTQGKCCSEHLLLS